MPNSESMKVNLRRVISTGNPYQGTMSGFGPTSEAAEMKSSQGEPTGSLSVLQLAALRGSNPLAWLMIGHEGAKKYFS